MRIEARLQEKGITLPEPIKPYPGVQVRFAWVRVRGNRAYISPHMELNKDGTVADLYGKVGAEVSLERAREAAGKAALAMLTTRLQGKYRSTKRLLGGDTGSLRGGSGVARPYGPWCSYTVRAVGNSSGRS